MLKPMLVSKNLILYELSCKKKKNLIIILICTLNVDFMVDGSTL